MVSTKAVQQVERCLDNSYKWAKGKAKEDNLRHYLRFRFSFTKNIIYPLHSMGLVEDVSHERVVTDTGLLNQFGEPLLLLGEWDGETASEFVVLDDQQTAVNLGFAKNFLDKVLVDARKYFSFLVCDAQISDFTNLGNRSLLHILGDRAERESRWQEVGTTLDRVNILRTSLIFALERVKRDPFFITPSYCLDTNSIQYLVPVRFNIGSEEAASSYLIIRRVNKDLWDIATILERAGAEKLSRVILPKRKGEAL
jgi:hypothetical protein